MTADEERELQEYRALGTPDELRKADRRSNILLTHIRSFPKPISEAWVDHLLTKKAL